MRSKGPYPGDEVVVHANRSQYKGILIGMTESEVYLKSPTRTWTIDMKRVQAVSVLNHSAEQSSTQTLNKTINQTD